MYYLNDRVTGANKRFDELGKRHILANELDTYVIVQQGQRPAWCPEEKVIYIKPYNKKIERLLSWLHLSWVLLKLPKGVLYSDFQPIPLFCGFKHYHYQLIHDLRNWTEFARGGLGKLSALFQRWQLKRSHKVVTVSQYTKDDIVSKCGLLSDNVIVSYNGITDEYTELKKPKLYDLVYVATYEDRKNHLNLIKAIEQITFEIKLNLVGRDLGTLPSINKYIELSDSKNVKNINFIESIDEAGLIDLYQKKSIYYPFIP